jgi:hypothetical protein
MRGDLRQIYLKPVLAPTEIGNLIDDEKKLLDVGYEIAESVAAPRVDGLQLHVATSETELTFTQPGIFFPFAWKVTFPSLPASDNRAVSVTLVRNGATFPVEDVREVKEAA